MRLNKFIAQATGISRRDADTAITDRRVLVNEKTAKLGQIITEKDIITLDEAILSLPDQTTTIMLNKPVGYVCSREGQGSKTIYELLPKELFKLKPVGRLDKYSSGLLLLTNDGSLAQQLTHPKFNKQKVYDIELNKPLKTEDKKTVETGVKVQSYTSKLTLNGSGKNWTITMTMGKNRQIRRTFDALGYTVTKLHRTKFGRYRLGSLQNGSYQEVNN